jgi:hypothetical protein
MRALTESEARVIAVLLAARPDHERERLHQVGIPRSTYHAVRRRSYQEGWLRDRYIPHPVPLGRPVVSVLVARPYADRADEFNRTLANDAGNVLLWTSSQVSLAVFFHVKVPDTQRLVQRLTSQKLSAAPITVSVRADGPAIPVYFDFEGLWSHLAGFEGTLAYPHGLGGGEASEEDEDATDHVRLSDHQQWAVGELLRRPFLATEQGRGGHLVGPFGLPFSQRKLLAKGWITHRTLLDPSRLPVFEGKAADQVVLVSGSPRTGARAEVLFATLTRESHVFPFLFVVGSERWLLGALGSSTPRAPEPAGTRRPVLPTLREYLEGIEIIQEPAAEFTTPVDHRYDRLIAETKGPPIGRAS